MPLLVDPNTVSFAEIKQGIIDFIKSKPEFQRWKDFFESSSGTTMIELLAGVSVYNVFQAVSNRREVYINHALLLSSVIGLSQGLGYSASRGTNTHLTLNVLPNQTTSISQFDSVGSVNDVAIIALEDRALTSNVADTISVAIGNLKTQTVVVNTSDVAIFRFTATDISEDIQLLLNDSEVPFDKFVRELENDKYLVQTNPLGGVDISYLNSGAFNYISGDLLQVKYIASANTAFVNSDLVFDFGTITLVTTDSDFKAVETIDSVRVNGPLSHETQGIIRGRDDFKKEFLQLDADFVDTNALDISPSVINLSYVKDDETFLTTSEKTSLTTSLNVFRPFGVEPVGTIVDPVRVLYNLNISATITESQQAVDTEGDFATVLDSFEKILGVTLNLDLVENGIEALSYVRVARVSFASNTWSVAGVHLRGDFVTPVIPDGFIYECTTAGTSDSAEPLFPGVLGATVSDGSVVWTCRGTDTSTLTVDWNEYVIATLNITLTQA